MTYAFSSDTPRHSHGYLLPVVRQALAPRSRIFEIGCGNGSFAKALEADGHEVWGVDPSERGIALANHPRLKIGSAYDDLANQYGRFPVVLSLEVVEHCYYPRRWAKTVFEMTEGMAIVSTPFHGYWKNLALAASGKMDGHFTALWDDGHIKFFSPRTFRALLEGAGFKDIRIQLAGRFPPFSKSMIAVCRA